ncbi:MAG: beta-lactamase family protein [Lachnospiraceae bacterium]|nr:beta-lactamase family protein [Lachnospiraceae bacterium]
MSDFRALDEYLNEVVKDGPSGCGCIVTKDGEFIYEGYAGVADTAKNTPITADSVYQQFSTTKVIICTALMMQVERGKLLLQDPVYKYFPEWEHTMVAEDHEDGTVTVRPVKRPIQVVDCLTMSMGIGYGGDDYTHRKLAEARAALSGTIGWNYTLRDDIRAVSQVPVKFDPGEGWLYGFGHELVAGLIEATSGMTVGEFLKKNIFEPLGMENTGYRYHGNMRENLVTTYLSEDGKRTDKTFADAFNGGNPMRRYEPDAKYEAGGAGLLSTVHDYAVFGTMLANGGEYKGQRIIGRKTIDLMRTNHLTPAQLAVFRNSYLDGYGYGLGVRTLMENSTSPTSAGEFGWTGMLGTYLVIDPAERVCLAYMHNMMPNNEEQIHHRVRNIVFGAIR